MKKGIAFLLAALLVLLTACAGSVGGSTEKPARRTTQSTQMPATQATEEATTESSTLPVATQEPTTPATEPQPDYSAVTVQDAFHQDVTVEGMDIAVSIPTVVFADTDLSAINEEIYQKAYDIYVRDLQEPMQEGYSVLLIGMNYSWWRNDSIVTVIVSTRIAWGSAEYYDVYSIDLASGTLLTQEELFALRGYDADSFYAKAKDVMGTYFLQLYGDMEGTQKQWLDQALEITVEESNVRSIVAYLGSDGTLWANAYIGSLAGADYYAYLIPIETAQVSDEYLNYQMG